MDFSALIESKVAVGVISSSLGINATFLAQRILGRRGLFAYLVWHNRIGLSADDAAFGAVRVSWNGKELRNLYSSTVELVNESQRDYQDVVVRVFSDNTDLLSERGELLGTRRLLSWTKGYSLSLAAVEAGRHTDAQLALYGSEREYIIPTMNRGQIVRVTILNAPTGESQPSIWLDIVHPGVKVRFCVAHQQILGTPQPVAALVGAGLGIPFLLIVVNLTDISWVVGLLCLIYGVFVVFPGVYCIKVWRWLREVTGG